MTNQQSTFSYQLKLHLIVVIFGFTGILGKLIHLPAEVIVLYRMSIASIVLAIYIWKFHDFEKVSAASKARWFVTGIIVGLHWFFFFESIKQSTVSIALVCFSSTAIFTAILEPLILKKKFLLYELFFGFLIICGMVLVLSFEFKYVLGIVYGVMSAFLASLFTVMNGRFIVNNPSRIISLYELFGGAVFILLAIGLYDPSTLLIFPSMSDVFYLLILAVVDSWMDFRKRFAVNRSDNGHNN